MLEWAVRDPLVEVLLYGIPALAALTFLLGWISYRGMIHYRSLAPEAIVAAGLEGGTIRAETLALPWLESRLRSPYGYELAVRALRGTADRLVIMHHGISLDWHGNFRYMEHFIREGWTVVAYDSRGHGETKSLEAGKGAGGRSSRPSYGVYEKFDLKAVADWALDTFAHSGGFVVLGESMGAASALQYVAIDGRADAIVADCSFSSAVAELDHRLKRSFVPFFLRPAVVMVADLFCRRLEGFSLHEASPERAVLAREVPILFVHGLDDDYVPWRMAVVMAESRRRRLSSALTELRLVPGARHAKSINVDPEGYSQSLGAFLSAALAGRIGRL
ncbi:MAG TPA: alpha/beta fold hydrolase [Rectinemataceae bacterium]|nr:alpha/beta fold hydrolase [Rectinemataceae bacterium]